MTRQKCVPLGQFTTMSRLRGFATLSALVLRRARWQAGVGNGHGQGHEMVSQGAPPAGALDVNVGAEHVSAPLHGGRGAHGVTYATGNGWISQSHVDFWAQPGRCACPLARHRDDRWRF